MVRITALTLTLALTLSSSTFKQQASTNRISSRRFGSLPSGEQIDLYTLRNSNGLEADITNYGGRIVSLKVPDRKREFGDIALGFDNLEGYLQKSQYYGAIVGRYANRIANGEFTLDGVTYKLARNNGPHAIHGGLKGFDNVVWSARTVPIGRYQGLELKYLSKDGEEGYPGNLNVTVRYVLTDDNELKIEYEATTDRDTVLNLTNHSFFDLSGKAIGNILEDQVTIYADKFVAIDPNLIPTGELRSVERTPFDFRKPMAIGARIDEKDPQLEYAKGYDHTFVLNRTGDEPSLAARVTDPKSGRVMEVLTTQPGVQFYTGNHLDGTAKGKAGKVYGFRSAFCMETGHFPNSPNQPSFPSTELKPGQLFHQITIFKFSVD